MINKLNQPVEVSESNFNDGDLEIYFTARQVFIAGIEVKLTPKEFNILKELVLRKGQPVTHQELLERAWGLDYAHSFSYVHDYINSLRRKIEPDPKKPIYIKNIPCIGYKFMTPAI